MPPSSSNLSDRSPKETSERRSSSETPSTTTRPRSPASLDAFSSTDRIRVPAKRARKTINCGPCRLSKLKCDRERPCSSCKLRDTTASCYYQGQDGGSPAVSRTDVSSVNTAVEFSKIRQSLALVEAHVNHIQRSSALSGSATPSQRSFDASITLGTPRLKEDPSNSDMSEPEAPGTRGLSSLGGLYAGPTSTFSLLTPGVRDGEDDVNTPERTPDILPAYDSDYDLCKELPPASVIDGLVDYYFEYCNWVYRFVNHRAFMAAWARYKSGARADRTVLATVCMIMAVALHYLPIDHELRRALPPDNEEIGKHLYSIMRLALQRKQTESRAYTLELVELHLIRTHELMVLKTNSEELWRIKGELVNIATAMGLHRDPGKEMPFEVAERRRWAWWNIIIIERWQAFLTGRPLAIVSRHFDTRMPSYCDPQVDPSGKLYDANIHSFRLAYILGDIMDDAVSLRPVPYESVLAKDRNLQEWWDTLPTELDMDDYTLVNFLASPTTSKRCMGVQSLVFRAGFLHVRFAIHRPYASLARSERSKYATSLDISINVAEKLIALSAHARPEMLNHTTVSTHMSWCPMHSFSAAMFFCFQIINNPGQAGAQFLRANVLRAISTLESFRGVRIAEKALDILHTLGPLYTEEFLSDTPEDRERKKQAVLPAVRRLQFLCVDSLNAPIGAAVEVAGSANGTLSPAQSSAHTDSPQSTGPGPDPMWGTTVHAQEPEIQSMRPQAPPATMLQPHQQQLLHQQRPQHPTCESLPSPKWSHADMSVGDPAQYPGQQQQGHPAAMRHEPQWYRDALPRQLADDEEAMWRSAAAHHSPTVTMVTSEPTGATTVTSTSRDALYAQQHMMRQQQAQDAYSQQGGGGDGGGGGGGHGAVDGRYDMGLRIVADSVLWGASGFVQGEWDRMYPELGCHT
ncbi:hypothetical protein F5888DRAFT_660765 [Russula emetica]|nr:hypothetical protein F5888DRAFT_660765 [Russula emetica]